MNYLEIPKIESIRMVDSTRIAQQTEVEQSVSGHNVLEASNVSYSQSIAHQETSIKHTKSKVLINSYLNSVNKQKRSIEKLEESKQKPIGKSTAQKLSLVSNIIDREREKDKQNRPSRANSKQKLHLTTLHPTIPSLHLNSRILPPGEQIVSSERDMFLNISITNKSESTQRDELSMKSRIQGLESQLSMVYSNLSLAKSSLDQQTSHLASMESLNEGLRREISNLEEKLKESIRVSQKAAEQKYGAIIKQKNERTNEVILQYQNQVSELQGQVSRATSQSAELRKMVESLKLHENLDNINTNKIIRELEMGNDRLVGEMKELEATHRMEKQEMAQIIDNHKSRWEAVSALLGTPSEETRIEDLGNIIQSSKKQKQLLCESIQSLTKRYSTSQSNLHQIVQENQNLSQSLQSLMTQLQTFKKQIQAGNEQRDTLKSQIISSSRLVQQTSRINEEYLTKSRTCLELEHKLSLLTETNDELKSQIDFLRDQRVTKQRLIFKIQESIQQQLESQKSAFTRQYADLQARYQHLLEQLDRHKNKRRMHKAIIQQSNHFYQQILTKCHQIYNTPH